MDMGEGSLVTKFQGKGDGQQYKGHYVDSSSDEPQMKVDSIIPCLCSSQNLLELSGVLTSKHLENACYFWLLTFSVYAIHQQTTNALSVKRSFCSL